MDPKIDIHWVKTMDENMGKGKRIFFFFFGFSRQGFSL
jgi:hypothetical protein